MSLSDLNAAARASDEAAPTSRPWTDPSAPATTRIESLLEEMTLEEKLAQLGSKWLGFGAENSENAFEKRFAIAQELITVRFVVKVDSNGPVFTGLADSVAHGSSSGQMVSVADDPT